MHNYKLIRKFPAFLIRILPAVFWILLIFGFDIPYIALITLICAVLHELAHIAATIILTDGFKFSGAVSGFRLKPEGHLSYKKEALIAAAGPAANFAVFLSTLPHLASGGYIAQLGIISLLTGISNLLPIEGYDGYRVVECIALYFGFGEWFFKAFKAVSFILISSMTFLSLYFMKRLDGGYWIFFVFISILIKSIKNGSNILFARKREKKRDLRRFQEFSSQETQENHSKSR